MTEPDLVEPFYLHFMNANLLTPTAEEEGAALWERFRGVLPLYDDATLERMLVGGWRSSKVAAWAIAASGRIALTPSVTKALFASPGYVEHLCICLAVLGSAEAAAALMRYLEGCADGSLQVNAFDETVGPHWALAALESLETGSEVPASGHRESLWARFVERQDTRSRGSFVRGREEAMALLPRAVEWLRSFRG